MYKSTGGIFYSQRVRELLKQQGLLYHAGSGDYVDKEALLITGGRRTRGLETTDCWREAL